MENQKNYIASIWSKEELFMLTIEKLKALLESGAITQEEFDAMAATIDTEPPADTQTEPPADTQTEPAIDYDKLDRIVQARVDKALAAERKEKAQLKQQLEKERKANKTDAELKQIEIEEREKTIADREKAMQDRENRLYAIKAIREAGLDDGSGNSLSIVDFVMGEDETDIDGKVTAFKELFNKAVEKAVEAEVSKRFKENGYTPKKGDNLNGGVNPFKAETFNLTEQIRILNQNPELAAQLKAAAGVN